MMKYILSLLCICCCSTAYATDTTWLNVTWRECKKDSATYFSINEKTDVACKKMMYLKSTQSIFITGYNADQDCNIRSGPFTWYDENGKVSDSILYQENKIVRLRHYHPNGQTKTLLIYGDSLRATYVNSWNEKGIETYIDTFYHNSKGKDCHKDTAFLQGIISKEDDLWHLRFFETQHHILVIDSWYLERLCKNRTRYFTYFHQAKPTRSIEYGSAGVVTSEKYWKYFKNGNVCNFRMYAPDKKWIMGKNWDSSGIEIPLDTSIRYSLPAEGIKSWKKNITKAINKSDSLDWKIRKKLNGNVFIMLHVDESGNSFTHIQEASAYPVMDTIILQSFRNNSHWSPLQKQGCCYEYKRRFCVSYLEGKVVNIL